MEFLQGISGFGVLQSKPPKRISESEQLAKMRDSFSLRATRQIGMIKSGSREKSGSWYVIQAAASGEDEYVLALRNGAKVIPLAGQLTHVRVPSADRAVEFYESAISACERGELDAALKATCRKPTKSKAPVQPVDTGAPATAA